MSSKTITYIVGGLAILLIIILEGIGISSMAIYYNNNYVLYSNVTCSSDSVNFLLGYGIVNWIIGIFWIPLIIINFLFNFDIFIDNQIYAAIGIMNALLTLILVSMGLMFSAYYFSAFKQNNCIINHDIWAMCLAILVINATIIGIFVITCCANMCGSYFYIDDDE